MANLDFYALGDDLRSLLRFVYAQTDIVIYELSSSHTSADYCVQSLRQIPGVLSKTVRNRKPSSG
jgi:hypothetical protein